MKGSPIILMLVILALFATAPAAMADELDMQGVITSDALKADVNQPYIVKKGDTLWDIADHFFKDPWKWLKIWERNLYITNPDLIYPGNKIWFDGTRAGGLSSVTPQPKVLIKPVERLEGEIDASIMMTALMRQDFINPDEVQGVGHLLASRDDRLNFAVHDRVYMKLNQPAKAGELFDVFRTTDAVVEPATGVAVGVLVIHLGQIRLISQEDGTYRGVVEKAFEEMSRGDRLKPARDANLKIRPQTAERALSGSVMYIRDDGREAGQHQVLGISLGIKDGIKAGTVLSIYQSGRAVDDAVSGKAVTLPKEKVGDLIVLVPQQSASLALITNSTAPIHIGDAVLSNGQQ